jgi:DNA-nicking Smr family endonuclease
MADDFLSEKDKALFRELMRSVKPLNKTNKILNEQKTTHPKKLSDAPKHLDRLHNATSPSWQRSLELNDQPNFLSNFISEPVCSNTILTYAVPSLPTKRVHALRNGHISWDAKLDLHGLRAEDARDALFQFIHSQVHNNNQCLLIIHGKGGQEGSPPVIKNLVNRWLPQFEQVLAFHSAKARDGGHGAVYVLLKRNRKG